MSIPEKRDIFANFTVYIQVNFGQHYNVTYATRYCRRKFKKFSSGTLKAHSLAGVLFRVLIWRIL